MKIIYKKFLIISTIIILIGLTSLHFYSDSNSETIVPKAYGSSLTTSTGADAAPLSSTVALGDKISSDTAFLETLVSLNKIKVDPAIFTDESFKALKDNTVEIKPVVAGRINPFAPIYVNNAGNIISVPNITTEQPTQVTDKTAVLNGTVNTANQVTDIHFEYGPTQGLSLTTQTADQSLVGAFIKNVSGLNPKTNYFYKACAKINSIKLCGNVVSFITN
jgi:hypothetical protein